MIALKKKLIENDRYVCLIVCFYVLKPPGSLLATDRSKAVVLV